MTVVEKLLVQLFERMHSIIDLAKQQTESYSQHLACEVLIDGITPPSWLWDPNTSASKELTKEDLISKILRPYPRPSVCCSVSHYPAYTNLVITGDNEELSDEDFVQNPAFNKDLDRKDDLTTPGFSGQDRGECVLNWMPEFDASVASPEDQTDGGILNFCTAPDQSLAGIQRSKSRQKALELRSSAKALAKSGLRHESTSDVVSSQIRFSPSIANQPGQNDEVSQSAEPSLIGGKSCEERNVVEAHFLSRETGVDTHSERIKSGLRHESTSDVVSSQIRFSLSIANQPGQNDEVSQSAEPSLIGGQSCEERNVVEAHCLSRETGVDTHSERITRSGSYVEVPISVEGSFPLGCSSENYKENASSQDARAKRRKSVPDDGRLEHIESGDIYTLNPDVGINFQSRSSSTDEYKYALDGMPYSVPLAYSGERYGWNSRNQLSSPVGKLGDQLSSHTGSSGNCSRSNPELTCFPIEEDPSSSEDNKIVEENAGDTQDETESSLANHSDKRQPLEDLTDMGKSSAEEVTLRAGSLDFLTSKLSVTRTQDKALLGPKYQFRKKSETREKQTSSIGAADGRKHQLSSIGPSAIKKAKQSGKNSTRKSMRNKISKTIVLNKTSLKEQDQKLSLTESRRDNIVSNVSSFIPLVQQKQAATDCTGKRDVKVKALEAAEAAKRLEERKENERKMRKEALKIERAKLEEKKLRDIVLEKKRKEEERKKKDAAIIAKKRLREEEERKEKERKRMRVEERQRQREQEEKKRTERPEKENQRTKDAQMNGKKEFNNESKWQQNRETTKGEGVTLQKAETNLSLNEVVVNYEECGISGLSCEAGQVMDAVDKTPRKEDLLVQNSKGKSYEISPYQCSEDEDEGDDEFPTKKYIPSWASKSSIALFLPLQQELDPDVFFPPDRFCSMDAVLLPRKLRNQQTTM